MIALLGQTDPKNFMAGFLRVFLHDDYHKEHVEKWIQVPFRLFESKLISKVDFIRSYNDFCNKEAISMYTDNRFVSEALAKMLLDFLQKGDLKLDEVKLEKGDTKDEDEIEERLDFFKDLLKKLERLDSVKVWF